MISNAFVYFIGVMLLMFALLLVQADKEKLQNENYRNCPTGTNIRRDMWNRMVVQTKALLMVEPTGPGKENVYVSPVVEILRRSITLVRIYHKGDGEFQLHVSKERFLRNPITLAHIWNKLNGSTSITGNVTIRTAVFYNSGAKLKPETHQVIKNLKKLYSGIEVHYDATRPILLEWLRGVTNEGNFPFPALPGGNEVVATIFQFSGCWHPYLIDQGNSFVDFTIAGRDPAEFNMIPAIFGKGEIEYLNNKERAYEALKLPFRTDFSMVIVLPYKNQSLEIFSSFSYEDFSNIFNSDKIRETKKLYVLPIINSAVVKINQNGILVNSNRNLECPMHRSKKLQELNDEGKYSVFRVNRPYAIFIYHEEVKTVHWLAYIRNPSSDEYKPHRFLDGSTTLNKIHNMHI